MNRELEEARKKCDGLVAALEHILAGSLSLPRFTEKEAREAIEQAKAGV